MFHTCLLLTIVWNEQTQQLGRVERHPGWPPHLQQPFDSVKLD